MAATLFKWIIYVSSYIPVFIMIFLNNLKSFSLKDIANLWNTNTIFWISVLLISFTSLVVLIIWLLSMRIASKSKQRKYKIEKINPNDSEVLNFFVTFIIPILSLKPDSYPSIVMNLLLLIIEGIFFVSNNALYFNVLLIIFGFHVYTFDSNNIIITRRKKDELDFEDSKASQIGTTNIFYI
jgi:hypothetical protein